MPGLYEVDLVVHGDERGWFKENYQKEKLEAIGLPPFDIVQNNFAYNEKTGVTRGLHAEPWDKFVSVANGRVFGVWVDLRSGPTFATTFTLELTPAKAVLVPRGVANGYQTLEDGVTYTYLVNAHWSQDATYRSVHPFDPDLAVAWPMGEDLAILSDKDAAQPRLADVGPPER